jgi:hypothetical protein
MPRKPIDYSKSVFYKIVCKDLTIKDLYVGSTTNFKTRKSQHKSSCNTNEDKHYNIKVYTFIRDNKGWDNWDMIMIHRQSCNDELESRKIERGFMETLNATLNSNVPGRSLKEYMDLTKDRRIARLEIYKNNNVEKISEKKKEWYQANKNMVKERINLNYHTNKDAINKKRRELYRNKKNQKLLSNIDI